MDLDKIRDLVAVGILSDDLDKRKDTLEVLFNSLSITGENRDIIEKNALSSNIETRRKVIDMVLVILNIKGLVKQEKELYKELEEIKKSI